MAIDGFYRFIFAGRGGSGVGLLAIQNGKITGIDAGGGRIDGSYTQDTETGHIEIDIEMLMPPNTRPVTGGPPRAEAWKLHIHTTLPASFAGALPVPIPTPSGTINISFELLREFVP